jgi:hypothetical protein
MNAAEAAGRVIGILLVLGAFVAVPVIMATRLRRRGSRSWWVPLPISGILVLLALLGLVYSAGDDREPARRLDPQSVFAAVEGFSFQEPTPEQEARAEALYREDPTIREVLLDVVVRTAADPNGSAVGTVVVVALDPAAAAEPGQEEGLAAGLAEAAGTEPQSVQVGDREVIEVTDPVRGITFLAWQRENLFVTVATEDVDVGRALTEAILLAGG